MPRREEHPGKRASDNKTIIALSDCFRSEEMLLGTTSITISLKLVIDQSQSAGAIYPEDKFITKTFQVDKLPHT